MEAFVIPVMNFIDAVLLAVGLLAAALWYQWSTPKLKLPPGPPASWPVLGNLSIFSSPQPHRELEKLAQEYGPIMSLRLGSKLGLIISSPDMAREVLKVQDENFASRPYMGPPRELGFIEGSCGFVGYGPSHQHVRKILITELFTAKRVLQTEMMRDEEVSAMITSILDDSKASGPVEVDIFEKLSSLTMNNMTQMMMRKRYHGFGKTKGSEATDYVSLITEMNHHLLDKLIGDFIPYLSFVDIFRKRAMRRLRDRLDDFLSRIIAQHRQNPKDSSQSPDFVDTLINLPEQQGVDKERFIKGVLLEMLQAGVDTSAVTVEWTMAETLRNPHVLKKAHEELDSVVGKERKVQEADLLNLPYIQAIVKESMRIHPTSPLMLPHYSIRPCKIGQYDIPSDTIVFVSIWNIQRSSAVWEDALLFNPDRFLVKNMDVKGQNIFDWLVFGFGRRGCPGRSLGWSITVLAFARLLHSFDWHLPHGDQDLDMSETFGITLPRTHHLKAVPTPRLPLHLY